MSTEVQSSSESKLDIHSVRYAANEAKVSEKAAAQVLLMMLEQDCTVPFIARYRKEMTGGLDEVQIAAIKEKFDEYNEREKRREYILKTIKEMEKLTPDLEKKILAADTIAKLEDIYAPYKSKKKTKGQKAIDAGLQPLADLILKSGLKLNEIQQKHEKEFINAEHKIENFEQALEGAMNIIIEDIAHQTELKETLRQDFWKDAVIKSSVKKGAEEIKDYLKYKDYFEFKQKISELTNEKNAHRFLAIRRGMMQKVLKVEIEYDEETALATVKSGAFDDDIKTACQQTLDQCIKAAYKRFLYPSLDLEIKSDLKKTSDESAISVFGVNLKNLLLQPYLGAKTVVGVDPGVRTGCKIAVVDHTGKFLVDTVIYPHPPQNNKIESAKIMEAIIEQFNVEFIAIGNGTFGRETLDYLKQYVKEIGSGKVKALTINEDGASIYSASEIARKEFPDKDPTVRGAISIARRFQDPLAELVKIDPKSIGVGQYQHDVNQAKLKKSLGSVVENCVNFVGVDLNTASAPLLSYVSGIGPTVAGNIVNHREKSGGFKSREELLKVSRFSQKVFEQAAGFLRIYNGANPLDGTFIHPEKYQELESWCQQNKVNVSDFVQDKELIAKFASDSSIKEKVGEFTHEDIVKALKAPSQDPRTEFVPFEYRDDIKSIEDIKVNQWYPGLVTNITQFGAFVDIGIKENGLIHLSQMADKFVESALDVLKVGQEVKARVMDVDHERKRISLSLKTDDGTAGASTSVSARVTKGKSNRKGNNSGSRPPANQGQKEIKNNPFAALKNFKVK